MNYQLDSVWVVDILDSSGFMADVRFLSMGRWYTVVVTTKVDTYALLLWVLLPPVQLNTITINDFKARRNAIDFIIQDGCKLLWGFPFIGHGNPDSSLESIANYVSSVDLGVDVTYVHCLWNPKCQSVEAACRNTVSSFGNLQNWARIIDSSSSHNHWSI
jgi:hypothetical protein